ncbi:MAG: CPBP family intramembrane metalloprotease [Alphaproteobacteria bacterium]|nr:CPBP family intramembrane metalloprotease [Alphaproteobacteria bacterium]
MTASRRIITLIGLALFLIVPELGLTKHLPTVPGVDPMYVQEWFWWALLAAALLYVLVVERRSLTSIGFRKPSWKTFVLGILFGILGVAGIIAIYSLLFPMLHLQLPAQEMEKLLHTPFWYRFFLVTRAATMEETLFRGYGIERTAELTGSRWLAGAVTWGLFTLAHLSAWGWAQLIVAGYGGLVLTALYLWRRDLVCNMIAHWVTDGAGFLLPR